MAITIIKKPAVFRRFITYDLEWTPGERLFFNNPDGSFAVDKRRTEPLQHRLTGVYDGQAYRRYNSVDDFLLGEMNTENRGAWFYAHAGGSYDMGFVLDRIIANVGTDERYTVTAAFSGSSAIIVHVSRGKNVWHFVDSYWLLRDSLASIGRFIGITKGDTADAAAWIRTRFGKPSFEALSKVEKVIFYTEAPADVLNSYTQVDCEILHKAIGAFEALLRDLGGQLQMTVASCALQLFRRKYLRHDIPTGDGINERASQAYHASRVEIYERWFNEPANRFDLNSSFPYAMTFPAPGRFTGRLSQNRELPLGTERLFLADVSVTVPDSYLPPLPFRAHGRTFFPVGSWRGWYNNVDLELLVEEGGTIDRVWEGVEFEPNTDLQEYAQDIYKRRDAAPDESFEKVGYKYLGNALYGKFGESPYKSQILVNPETIDRVGDPDNGIGPMEEYMPGVWRKDIKVPIAHAHVPLSAHIVAVARRTLYRGQRDLERIYYSDTDSIDTPSILTSDRVGRALGAFKHEASLTRGYYAAPKMYSFAAYWCYEHGLEDPATGKRKGKSALGPDCRACGKPAVERLFQKAKGFSEMDEFKFDLLINGKAIPFQRMARLKELYQGQTSAPVEVLIEKAVRGLSLSKRFFYPDGSTRPWHVDELRQGDSSESFEDKKYAIEQFKFVPEEEIASVGDLTDLPF